MHPETLGEFDVVHLQLAWPWVAIEPRRARLAFASAADRVETRALEGDALVAGPSFALPADLTLPTQKAPSTGHRGAEAGVHGFALHPTDALLAVTGTAEGVSHVVTIEPGGELRRSRADSLAGGDFTAHAVTFDRTGARLWVSLESESETALLCLDPRTHAVFGLCKSAALPPPSVHELHVHAQDDAVLLLAACGQDGTFARVAGWSDGPPASVASALDQGSNPAGFVGFSSDGARVHVVEADALRTHAWPTLEELASVPLPEEFMSSYSGAVLGDRILVDGERAETGEPAVMQFDRAAVRGGIVNGLAPTGMWVGRLGSDAIVTVEPKGDPARARVVRLAAPKG